MAQKQSIGQLRSALRRFRGRVETGRDDKLVSLNYQFFFLADDAEDEIEISEGEFDGEQSSGHPMPGIYKVRAINGEGNVVFEEIGAWQEKREAAIGEPKPGDSQADQAKKLVAIAHQDAYVAAGNARRAAEENERLLVRLKEAETRCDAKEVAISGLKQECLQFEKQRDQAFVERDRAFDERDAILEEFEAYKQRGGELQPYIENIAAKGIDRAAELLGLMPSGSSEHVEAQEKLIHVLIRDRLEDLLAYAQAGIIPWDVLRYLIITYYDTDPGPEPVDPDWKPPQAEAQQEAAE